MRRRTLLSGAAGGFGLLATGVILVEKRVLPGRIILNTALGLTGPDGKIPAIRPGRRVSDSFASEACPGVTVRWAASYPPDAEPDDSLPVVVFLHGRHEDHRYGFNQLGLDRFLAALVAAGTPPFVLATVDGGRDSYWHPRRAGDPETMLWNEFLPRLADRGLRTDRIGLYGFSMGGYGALLFAARRPERVAAVAAIAPAIWSTHEMTSRGAFDDAADFRANDIYAHLDGLAGIPLRIDCGNDDPFTPNIEDFAEALPERPEGGFQSGSHTAGYVRRMAPAELRFL
ncbi:MAG: alpha/beta hydrolase, partial [Micromonosporaceae bacterium]